MAAEPASSSETLSKAQAGGSAPRVQDACQESRGGLGVVALLTRPMRSSGDSLALGMEIPTSCTGATRGGMTIPCAPRRTPHC